jgi:bifunctional polynucleotide phosphatase/kinase
MSFKQEQGMYYHIPKQYIPKPYIASFDVDWTVTYSQRHLFPKERDDIFILPNRLEKLQEFHDSGYNIVFFTNQSSKSRKEKEKRRDRMKTFIELLPFPCYLFIATDKDNYRKPCIGMWNKVKEFIPNINMSLSFYCGDAAGRQQDFSDSDRVFAQNANIKFFTPEEIFDETKVSFSGKNDMIIFVGMPGSGKSTFYKEYLNTLNYIHISQDILKTKQKVLKAISISIDKGESMCIDATNPTLEGRQVFYDLANKHGYSVTVVYFIRDGRGWNDLRKDNRVSTIVYHIYFKKLDPPTENNTPGKLYMIS